MQTDDSFTKEVTKTAVDYFNENRPVYTENELQAALSQQREQVRSFIAEELLAVTRMKKDDITRYIVMVNIAKRLQAESIK